ncbi:MAG: TRAP transporter substrate-binding protein DctP [Rhodospirillaceae bacterium]|nr:TRAP transporter substrate-binding protein DctP [Rhodospirillaceae bacterium]
MKRTLAFAATAALALGFAGNAAAETVLKFSHPFTAQDARHKLAEEIAKRMAAKTNGQVKIEIYPNQQLFKARQQYDGLRTNQIDFAIYPMPWLSGKVPAANIGLLPGIVESPRAALVWRDRKIWDVLSAAVAKADVNMVSIFWDSVTYASKGKLPMTPADVKGLKVRGMGKPLEVMLAKEGAAISSMPAADTYFAMQSGALNVLFSTVSSFAGYRMYEVIDHIVAGKSLLAGGHFILMSNGAKQKLGKENLAKLDEVMKEGEQLFTTWVEEKTQKTLKEFADKGVKVVELSPAQYDSWTKTAKEVAWKNFVQSTPNGQAVLDSVSQPRK